MLAHTGLICKQPLRRVYAPAALASPAGARRGQDYEVTVPVTLEEAYLGTEVSLDLSTTDVDAEGRVRRVPKRVKARIPKGPTDGQVLRLPGQDEGWLQLPGWRQPSVLKHAQHTQQPPCCAAFHSSRRQDDSLRWLWGSTFPHC